MTGSVYKRIKNKYDRVKLRIQSAAQSVGRDPDEIRLMVVTKAHPVNIVEAVVASGARILGENYVEEAIRKINAIDNEDVEWHMIGHVQSRKARQVCDHFSWVHSLDRRKIARRLNNFAGQNNMKMPVLLECNVSGEETKFGYSVWNPKQWPEFVDEVAFILELDNLEVKGLMTMPPWNIDPEASRSHFQYLRRLQDFLCQKYPEASWKELSMGMSNDFEVAIQEGATIIRVGTAILGPRIND